MSLACVLVRHGRGVVFDQLSAQRNAMNLITRTTCALALTVLGAGVAPLFAQDIHYSNLSAVPMQTNPAYTGLMEHRMRVGFNHRSQWSNFTNGYKTTSLSADVKAWQNRGDVLGLGVHLTSDQAGDLDFSTQQVSINTAYTKVLDRNRTFLSFGLQNVFSSQRLDWSKAQGFEYEPLSALESGGRAAFWDVGAGMALFFRPSRRQAWFAGLAGAHLNNPDVTFLGYESDGLGDRLYTKWTFHAGGELHFGPFNSIRPSLLILHQGPNRQIKLGTFWRYKADNGLHTDAQIAVHFGAWLRTYLAQGGSGVDAVNLATRFDYGMTSVVVSFDVNVSSLIVATDGFGGPEVALVQQLDWGTSRKRRHRVKCPTFQY